MNLHRLFSTCMWETYLPSFDDDLKKEFIEQIYEYKEENPISQNKNLINGYESPTSLHVKEKLSPIFEHVCNLAMHAAKDLGFYNCDVFVTSSWANICNSRESMIPDHVHGDVFSGVFYVSCPENSGKLCIKNPFINDMWIGSNLIEEKTEVNAKCTKIEPMEGFLYLWPSFMPHSTEPNLHDEERISISFNVILLRKNTMISND